jgi:hypothetical protein
VQSHLPLVLALESDLTQATRIAALAPSCIDAEIVIVDSLDAALEMLASAAPDLILTPLLISPDDDAALGARLRALDSQGVHLQRLVTPSLGSGDAQPPVPGKKGGLLNRIRNPKRAKAAADGCDPSVFAAQVNECLARVAAERHDRQSAFREEAPPVLETGANEDEPSVITPPGPDELHATRDGIGEHAMATIEDALPQRSGPAARAKRPKPQRSDQRSGSAPQPPSLSLAKRPTPAVRPMQDEWGLYDPEQCGFSALLERLQQLADTQAEEKEQDRRSGIMRR